MNIMYFECFYSFTLDIVFLCSLFMLRATKKVEYISTLSFFVDSRDCSVSVCPSKETNPQQIEKKICVSSSRLSFSIDHCMFLLHAYDISGHRGETSVRINLSPVRSLVPLRFDRLFPHFSLILSLAYAN